MPGSVTASEADWFVDPANGSRTNSGTTENDALDSIFAFDEDSAFSLSVGETVALMNTGVDSISSQLTFFGFGDVNGSAVTIGTLDTNDGDYIIDGPEGQSNCLWMSAVNNFDWIGAEGSKIVVRSVDNNAMVWTNGAGDSTIRWMRCEDYGNDSPNRTGNGIWFAQDCFNMEVFDTVCTDGSAYRDSDGFYIGAADPFSGDHKFVRCTASYNCDDGFDFFRSDRDRPSVLINCVAHHNGRDLATWQTGDDTYGGSPVEGDIWGDGNGFKLGGDFGGNNWAYRCLSYLNKGRNQGGAGEPNGSGFDDNGYDGNKYFNCTSYDNEEWGFRISGDGTLLINNIAHFNGDGAVTGGRSDVNNSWDLGGVSISDADFQSVTESDSGFLVPASDSEVVDAGVVLDGYTVNTGSYSNYTIDLANDPPYAITEGFDSSAPDLGYIETTGSSGPEGSGEGYGEDGYGATGYGNNVVVDPSGGMIYLNGALIYGDGAARVN